MSALILLIIWSAATACLVGAFSRRLWHTQPPRLRLYLVVGWALVSIGVIQTMLSPLRFRSFDEVALWFATAGMAVALTGALNLLNLARELDDRGLRYVCLAANIVITVVFVAVATHRMEAPPHDPVSISLVIVGIAATVLSTGLARRAPGSRTNNFTDTGSA